MELMPEEVKAMADTPEALELLADWHEVQLTQADAINDGGVYDGSIKYHTERKAQLLARAERLRAAE
jgi:hypothetical protein